MFKHKKRRGAPLSQLSVSEAFRRASGIPKSKANPPMPPVKPPWDIALPPERVSAIKTLRMIADDLIRGCDGFSFLIGYDFSNLYSDIMNGEAKRRKTEDDG